MNENIYFSAIRELTDETDILNAIPDPTHETGLTLLEQLIEDLDKELVSSYELLKNTPTDDIEMVEYIRTDINLLQFKKDVCLKKLEKCKNDLKIEDDALLVPKKNIVFATTDAGNVCIENDIKNIPEEFYDSVSKMIETLQEGVTENNAQKAKTFTSTHKKLSRIHEIKEFKVRLFYKNLSADTVYVLMARMKKADNDRLDTEEIENRVLLTNKQYEKIKKAIKDPKLKEIIIQENKNILDNLSAYLNQNKR